MGDEEKLEDNEEENDAEENGDFDEVDNEIVGKVINNEKLGKNY